jgi:multisubunit Na+/H+ antiporter MnhG subunit
MLAASLGLISFNDWYILNRAAHRKSSIEALEALFALEDLRGIGQPRPPHRS